MKDHVEIKTTAPTNNVTENVYNTKIKEKVDELNTKYAEEVKQKCQKCGSRSFTDFLDPETKAMYEGKVLITKKNLLG